MNISERIEEYITYFRHLNLQVSLQPGPKGLPAYKEGEYKQKVYEICDILNIALGKTDTYPLEIKNIYENVRGDWGIVSLSNIKQVLALVEAAFKKYLIQQENPKETIIMSPQPYINPERLEEIRKLKSTRLDFKRLVRMCEELEIAHQNNCTISIAMLIRAIIDHIPPVFSLKTFQEIANNTSINKSFRDAMQYLEQFSRKVADHYLHVPIRKSEFLPNPTQVNCSAQLDLLLSEIIRIVISENKS
jgi:hypothetical protein